MDLGSIAYVDEENDELWRFGVDEFMRCCLYPAVIATRHPHATGSVRNLLKKRQMGLSHDEAALALGAEDLHRVNSWRAFSGRKLDLVEELQSYVKELRFEVDETSWGDYRGEGILPQVVSGNFLKKNSDPRFARISKEAQATRAKTFIDAGANDGLFSLLLTNLGMNGIAFDIDEKSINKLYEFLRNQPSINLVASLEDFESAPYEADLVLGLALTHHLYFTVGLTFDAMAAKFAEMTKNVLITEFMPDGLGGTPVHPKPAPIPFPKEYNIEAFLAAFRNKFGSVEVVNYKRRGPSTRTLVVCKK